MESVGADRGAIIGRDRETGALRPMLARRSGGQDGRMLLSSMIVQDVVSSRAAVVTADAQTDERHGEVESVQSGGIRSGISPPLIERMSPSDASPSVASVIGNSPVSMSMPSSLAIRSCRIRSS